MTALSVIISTRWPCCAIRAPLHPQREACRGDLPGKLARTVSPCIPSRWATRACAGRRRAFRVASAPGRACEFNIEGNPFHGLIDFVAQVRPHQCTFVPDETGAFTSDHGWNLPADAERLAR